jgi:xylulokinase
MPALLWNDSRGTDECAELVCRVPRIAEVTGVQPMAGLSAAKLLWLRKHRAESFTAIAHVMLAKDYVRLWLTGEIGSDMSDAAGTQLFDEANRRWWPDAVAAVGLAERQMPPLFEGSDIVGRLRPDIAAELGLPAGLPVAAGGGDAGTGSLGIGCIPRGEGFISLGTGAVFVVADDRYAPKPETMLHGSRNRFWGEIIANVTGMTLLPYRGAEFGPALGAARLAILAATKTSIGVVARRPEAAEPILAEVGMTARYAERYERYRTLYRSVEELFRPEHQRPEFESAGRAGSSEPYSP